MSAKLLDITFVLILLVNFYALASGRLRGVIVAVALQGILLGIAYPVAHIGPNAALSPSESEFWADARLFSLALVMTALKGFVIPIMLLRAMRRAGVGSKVDSVIGLMPTMLIGALGTGLAMAFAGKMPLKADHANDLLVPTSLATVFTGLLLLTTRRQALVQVLGYVVLENGIFVFGLLLINAIPDIVEMGVLLDLFVGVFVMGIIVHHISRAFPTASSEHLSALRE